MVQEIIPVSAAFTMDETCAHIPEGFIANPTNCKGYGYCKDGKVYLNGTCPGDYIYNSEDATCDYPSRFQCKVGSVESICEYSDNIAETFADPNDCSRYCQCKNKKAICNTCPANQKYDSSFNKCVWNNDESVFCLSKSICRLIPNGVFAADPNVCGGYVGCAKGNGNPGECREGFYFNPQIGMCQEGTLPCSNDNTSGSETSSKPCGDYTGTNNEVQFLPDKKTCYGYYACTSSKDNGVWYKCPPNLHFNDGQCVTPYTFACEKDRCGNMDQQFVGSIYNDCHNYLYCQNQSSVSENGEYVGTACPNNYYFNEFTGGCQKESPASDTYKLCTAAPAAGGSS